MEHGAGVGYTTAVSSVKMQNSQDKRTTGGVPGQTAQKRRDVISLGGNENTLLVNIP